eukprot:Unigene5680_Nuclearia_a/m.17335 Unigene5680_Nuclearia_a/g.17335  ORF Unigene5680_Nuclearia_a/g.17335 Unigene5680_Nuclearia_a/m.17335 type:complete len:775 (+) Unigene5680_Nuclearia_a:34-2358(+)
MNLSDARISVTARRPSSTRDIHLPNQLEDVSVVALDIGGSLSKVVYFSRKQVDYDAGDGSPGGRLHFERFPSKPLDECLRFVERITEDSRRAGRPLVIRATGGGAHKYADEIYRRLGIRLQPFDEMRCLIVGLNFLLREVPYEVFTVQPDTSAMSFQELPRWDGVFPYMLVNIGSGVSILKVTSPTTYQRVSGTSLGGGTLWGLLSLLTDCKDYDSMLALATQGDNRNVDMLVGDIYGMDYGSIGLKSTTIASCFGKCFQRESGSDAPKPQFRPEDICKSALLMVSNNIGQIAYLNATVHNISRIYFGGSFIRGHVDTMRTISYAISFWSKGSAQALFLRHDGYIGALGAFLVEDLPPPDSGADDSRSADLQAISSDDARVVETPNPMARGGSFIENFARSNSISDSSPGSLGFLDTTRNNLVACPLLADLATYEPDTLHLESHERRQFWLKSFEDSIDNTIQVVLSSMGDTPELRQKTDEFVKAYKSFLARLQSEPGAFGGLSVRSLLDVREQCLHEYVSADPLKQLKHRENAHAISSLAGRLDFLRGLDEARRQREIIAGLLSGNMFDWGAREVVKEINKGGLDFDNAAELIHRGNAELDYTEAFCRRLNGGPAHTKAIIFADNCGQDIVLGIVPFALYLLGRGTQVVIACNSRPALNDITHSEMLSLAGAISEVSAEFQEAYRSGRLSVMPSGQQSPCLNLARINSTLARACKDADLLVLHGMGRAIHTNLRARFRCDTLKLAVIKSAVVARELNARMYDAVVLFEPGATA